MRDEVISTLTGALVSGYLSLTLTAYLALCRRWQRQVRAWLMAKEAPR